jgi:hypothetical protein
VIVPLPFAATRVSFDEQNRELTPPADVAAFEIPRESGLRHLVTALAADGAKAEAYVRESEGVARPEGPGFTIEALETFGEEAAQGKLTPSGNLMELPPTPNGVKRVVKARPGPARPPKPLPAPTISASALPAPKPVGTVKDGFTKLR